MRDDYPKEVILRDGTGVTLRLLRKEDRDPLLEMFSRLSEDDRWFLDGSLPDPAAEEKGMEKTSRNTMLSIAAFLEGKIIANGTLVRTCCGATSHVGKVRISVDPVFRGKYLATWMLLDLINLAMAWGLEILIMRLVQDKDLYLIRSVKKLDFSEEAILEDYVRDRQGNPHNLVIMIKRLHRVWNQMPDDMPVTRKVTDRNRALGG
jgi:hypothetical protein